MAKQVTIGINALVGRALAEKIGVSFTQGGQEISCLRDDDEKPLPRDIVAEVDEPFTQAILRPTTLAGELFVSLLREGA